MALLSDVEAEAMSTSRTAEDEYQLLSATDARIFLHVLGRFVLVLTSKIRDAVAERGNSDLCPDVPDTRPLALVRLSQAEFKAPLATHRSRLNLTEFTVEASLDSAFKEWRSLEHRSPSTPTSMTEWQRPWKTGISWTRYFMSAWTTLA
jgi:hypothetical protein